MSDEIADKIEDAAKNPKRVRTDAGEVEAHPLPDQIAADKYLASKAAVANGNRGLRFNKLSPTPD